MILCVTLQTLKGVNKCLVVLKTVKIGIEV